MLKFLEHHTGVYIEFYNVGIVAELECRLPTDESISGIVALTCMVHEFYSKLKFK